MKIVSLLTGLLMLFLNSASRVQGQALPTHADLPPLMKFLDGRPVLSPSDWIERKAEIRQSWFTYYLGSFPETTPALLASEIIHEKPIEGNLVRRDVRLTFDTPGKASFEIRLWIPSTRQKPSPLLLTQPRHYQLAWAKEAVRRGYVVCFYPGVDYNHEEKDFPGYQNVWRTFQKEYPDATWHSSLAIQGWLAGRALDYLLSGEAGLEVAAQHVGIIGHSRYGKQSLYAAAFDPRITAVVARSSGSPTAAGYRFTGRHTFMETVMDAPAEWALPGLRNFYGHENQLPVEGEGLLGLIAPRPCLLHTAYHDGSDPTFAVERIYRAGKKAYEFLKKPDNLALQYREGNHDPITDTHVRQNLDWFDWAFGRGDRIRSSFPEIFLHYFNWEAWKEQQLPADLREPDPTADLPARLHWVMGLEPAYAKREVPLTLKPEEAPGVTRWSHDRWKPSGVTRLPVSFGRNVQGNLMYPDNANGPLPVIIWLHPYNYSHGYNEGYGVEGTTVYYRLAQAGYAVLCYDQVGFGDRLLEGSHFYNRYPTWSKLGRMMVDVRDAIDFISGKPGLTDGKLPTLDADQIYLLGYSLGGMVALHAAALDERVKGVASFCGFTPLRTDTDDQSTGGIRRLWEWHGLLPRLGLFHEREKDIPYDYEDLLQAIAPRPTLIYAAQNDWHATMADVEDCVSRAPRETLAFMAADDINRFQSKQQGLFMDWLKNNLGK